MASYECSKKLLYVFNFIFWIGGAALVAFGVWMKLDPTLVNYLVVVNIRGADPMLTYAAYIFMAAGGLALIVGFFGCCGAMRDNQPLLFIYIVFLVLIMTGEIVGGVLALLYRSKIETHLITSMEQQIRFDYSPGTQEMKAWDFLQQQHMCCGGNSSIDYKYSKWWNETRTYVNRTSKMEAVPNSCCKPGSTIAACQRDANLTFTGSDEFYSKGCYNSLEVWIKRHSLIMMILGLAIGGAQVFSFIAACCVRSGMKKNRDPIQLVA